MCLNLESSRVLFFLEMYITSILCSVILGVCVKFVALGGIIQEGKSSL